MKNNQVLNKTITTIFDLYKSQLTLQVELKESPPVNDVPQHLFILRDFLQYNILMGNEFTKYPSHSKLICTICTINYGIYIHRLHIYDTRATDYLLMQLQN